MNGLLYTLVVIVGPLLLAGVILFAVLRNRSTPRQNARTEQATRDLYKQQSAEDEPRTP